SKYTYIWGNAWYKTLEDYAEARLGESVTGWTEDQIIAKLDILENYQASAVANPGINSSVVVLPPTSIVVGGGWHREHEPRPVANNANGQAIIKQICLADPDNTDTEPESDDELIPTSGPPPPPAPPAPPAVRAENPHPPIATLTRSSTATTMLETLLEGQTTESPSLGSPSVSHFPPLPQLLPPMNPPCGLVRARLQARVAMQGLVQDLTQEDSGEDEGVQMDGLMPSQQEAQQEGPPITYAGYRSHLDSPDDTSGEPPTAPPPTGVNTPAPSKKQSRHPANSVLAHLERAQAVDAVRDFVCAGRAKAISHSRIRPQRTEPSAPPKTSVQQPSSSRSGKKPSRRLDPVGAAQADLVEFNKRCAHDGVRNFVQGVTRQNERIGRCTLREGEVRSPTDLLADNEEDRAHDEALREGKLPAGGRKKKPQARDFSGIRGHILTLAKLHLFAFALSEGIYQTRATLMMWVALVHEATWLMELPNVPYVAATTEELEVMVNYIATLRGKIKERVRPVLSHVEGFDHCVATQEDIQTNLDLFHELYPNSFHCTSRRPRKGHYENVLLARCIAAAFFYGPNSVGVLFPDYFEDMPLTIVAFILAIIQFCLEEWSDGYFVSRDLGAGNMLDKYEAHLTGLKDFRKAAPRRLEKLQDGWFEYASQYSGATFVREKSGQEPGPCSEFRPDTPPPSPSPPPESPSQGSSHGGNNASALAATNAPTNVVMEEDDLYNHPPSLHPETNPFLAPDDRCASTPHDVEHAPTPTPDAEFNERGYPTAQSKGKGRACD
ncbi:hypothetical protein FRC06_007423, partial [Ceratobasidium sp. 370]